MIASQISITKPALNAEAPSKSEIVAPIRVQTLPDPAVFPKRPSCERQAQRLTVVDLSLAPKEVAIIHTSDGLRKGIVVRIGF